MEPCRDIQCLLDRLRGRTQSTTVSESQPAMDTTTLRSFGIDDENDNQFFPVNSSFRILLPILLVLGVFILIAIGLIIHRLVIKVLRKRWVSRRSNNVQTTSHGALRGTTHRRRGSGGDVNTVSGYVDSPPTYRQVLDTIENGESPPPYYQVASGVVNIGFVDEQADRSRDTNDQSNQVRSTNHESVQTSDIIPQSGAADTRSHRVPMTTMPPVETPRLRIDDIIDSISVPSNALESVTRNGVVKVKQGHRVLRASVSLPFTEPTGVQVTDFTSSAAPKTTVTIASDSIESAISRPSLQSAVQATSV
uniref:Uncharacterized protein LOC100178799 n=1 Tax=Phallusia mammillata TaxID=59560 RepID=A0A6F9DGC9_9ASCI|nr:uncharacterized protein LOC100178799 [Phallusia mammillata]